MIKAVIFDWAGTAVDFGSLAPLRAFVKLFESVGMVASVDAVRAAMGQNKREHLQALLDTPKVQSQWVNLYKKAPTKKDADRLFANFIPMNKLSIVERSELVPGMADLVRSLAAKKIKIGATTGYSRELMEVLSPLASEQGYCPDVCICADDVSSGRPSPQMMLACAEFFGISDPLSFVKVDDTLPGIEEGRNFGCWTVGVAISGNALGLSRQELEALPEQEAERKKAMARDKIHDMLPDFTIDTIADFLPVLEEINSRILLKQRPGKY